MRTTAATRRRAAPRSWPPVRCVHFHPAGGAKHMMAVLGNHQTLFVLAAAILILIVLVLWLGLRIIAEAESGLVVKKFGPPLPAGRIVGTRGEAGYQARLLPPGWHFPVWRWRYQVERTPLVVVPPGQIALVVAADGLPIPPVRLLGREAECSSF